jgi:hypothetical protein
LEGFRVLEGIGDCLRDGGRDLDPPAELVVGDLQIEGLEHLALDLGRRLGQRLGQVGDTGELAGQLLVFGLLALGPLLRILGMLSSDEVRR